MNEEDTTNWQFSLYGAPTLWHPDVPSETFINGEELDMHQRTFTFKKNDLIKAITENRNNHRAAFEAALKAYRDEVIETLENQLDQAKRGDRIPRGHGLVCPMDMTKEYDQILDILDMTTDEEIELSQQEFGQYVLDQWNWKTQFANSTCAYLENTGAELDSFGNALKID